MTGLLVAAFLSAPGSAGAEPRGSDLRACAEAATEKERHARRCWRYDAVERGTFRAYDRDTPRDWREPKSWERR